MTWLHILTYLHKFLWDRASSGEREEDLAELATWAKVQAVSYVLCSVFLGLPLHYKVDWQVVVKSWFLLQDHNTYGCIQTSHREASYLSCIINDRRPKYYFATTDTKLAQLSKQFTEIFLPLVEKYKKRGCGNEWGWWVQWMVTSVREGWIAYVVGSGGGGSIWQLITALPTLLYNIIIVKYEVCTTRSYGHDVTIHSRSGQSIKEPWSIIMLSLLRIH